MNGVNLKATGGLRVMNGAMAQCRSIKDFCSRLPHIHRVTCRQSVDIALELLVPRQATLFW